MKKIPVLAAIIFLFLALPAFAEFAAPRLRQKNSRKRRAFPLSLKTARGL